MGGMEAAHLLPAADVLRRFSVTAEVGLSPAQVTGARERYGPNGESAGGRGSRGRAVSVSPLRRGRGAVLSPSSSRTPRAGRKRGLRKPLQMLLSHPAALRGGCLRWGAGLRWVPGSDNGRLAPGVRSSPCGARYLCGASASHLHPRPIHFGKPWAPPPPPTPSGCQRCIPAPHGQPAHRAGAPLRSAGEGPARDSEVQLPS